MCSLCVYPFCSKTLSLRFRCANKSKLPLELMCKTRGQHKSALQRVEGESFRCPTPSPKMAPWSSCPAAISLRSPPHPPWWLTVCDMGMFNIQVSYSILHRYMTIVSWSARVAGTLNKPCWTTDCTWGKVVVRTCGLLNGFIGYVSKCPCYMCCFLIPNRVFELAAIDMLVWVWDKSADTGHAVKLAAIDMLVFTSPHWPAESERPPRQCAASTYLNGLASAVKRWWFYFDNQDITTFNVQFHSC